MGENRYIGVNKPPKLGKIQESLTDFLFPWGTYCVCCGNFIDRHRSYCLCDHCISRISWGNVEVPVPADWPLDSVRCCMKYGIYGRRLIFALKYNGETYVARILARMISDRLIGDPKAAQVLQADYIVPVPLHRDRQKKRGFNQTEKIGGYMAGYLGIPMLRGGLERAENTAPQRSVSGDERFANMEHAFRPGYGLSGRVENKRLILLDDVFTTGATAFHCGAILKNAGAARVDMVAAATGNETAFGFFDT